MHPAWYFGRNTAGGIGCINRRRASAVAVRHRWAIISFGVTSAYLLSEVVAGEGVAAGADFLYQLAASGGRELDLFSDGDEV